MLKSLPPLQQLAPPATISIQLFLALPSQWLFSVIEPQALTQRQSIIFNWLVASLLICVLRAWLSNPGVIPSDYTQRQAKSSSNTETKSETLERRRRWCRRCNALKPPRAHHCKTCKRCIPKMDHHCPWLANCVSYRIWPHFVRFTIYSVVAIIYLEYLLAIRFQVLWQKRKLPSYLGPSIFQLSLLFIEGVLNTIVLIGMGVLCLRTLYCLGSNQTTIEGWEIERHETLLRRARVTGGFLEAPGGERVKISRQEFPWDIGIFSNVAQGMGSKNPIMWLFPLAPSLPIDGGLEFEDNEIEESSVSWPPPDPDRMFRREKAMNDADAFTQQMDVDSFRKRQEADQMRYSGGHTAYRRKPFHVRLEEQREKAKEEGYEYDSDEYAIIDQDEEDRNSEIEEAKRTLVAEEGEESWRNSEGERLADFGVDEDAEFYDEDDLPLAELMRRRKAGCI